MDSIGYVFVEREITELLVASINVWDVKSKDMESKTRNFVNTTGEVYWKINIGIKKAKDTLIVTT